jgi:thiosulfate reductase cytochrome b subunit
MIFRGRLLHPIYGVLIFVGLLLIVGGWQALDASAALTFKPAAQTSPLHPDITLLDEVGVNVLESGKPVSTMRTCGECHDTAFIAEHSGHSQAGLDTLAPPGSTATGRPWDISDGIFGKWDPMVYRVLSAQGGPALDLGTAGWVQSIGARHVGGGPAQTSRDGTPLQDLPARTDDPETSWLDPETGQVLPWDWEQSGVIEMNCFLCHTADPDNAARTQSLQQGAFGWANTATLLGTGLVERSGDSYRWNADTFAEDGTVAAAQLSIQDPVNENCGLCHGLVHDEGDDPIVAVSCDPAIRRTVTTGQIIAPERLSDSGMNLVGKEDLTRPWDVHAERRVECTDCHYSLNNPVYFQEAESARPEHLTFDPRRLELGEYLYQPLHDLARGPSLTDQVTPEQAGSMRRCDSCHSSEATHDWLPYKDRHLAVLSCETCHVPDMYSNAARQLDWTVLRPDSFGRGVCRGTSTTVGGQPVITGFQPVWMPRQEPDGSAPLSPYNLVTTWFWVAGDPAQPVRLADLEAVWFEGDGYAPDVVAVLDTDSDGALADEELQLDTPQKVELIAERLATIGVDKPRIVGEIQPYGIHHTVATDEWAIQDCQTCHSDESRVTQSFALASYVPPGAEAAFVGGSTAIASGEIVTSPDGGLVYEPDTESRNLYVIGHNRAEWVDWLGGLLFLGVLAGIVVHGGLRVIAAMRHRGEAHEPATEAVRMYGVYERLWHWLQTFAIVALLFTGLVIHRPDTFGIFSFRGVVLVHNILAAILVVNAGLSLFYHVTSGEIRQFIPRPVGFFDQAILQAKYYLKGIFRGEPHPFDKTPGRKLNPLQQVTYFGILNVLLPLMILTGILMWGAERWPEFSALIGGLTVLGPVHSGVAWMLASFIVGHVYLTTTGPKPFSSLQGMMFGTEEVEKGHLETQGGEV